jgi:hypothetical protein
MRPDRTNRILLILLALILLAAGIAGILAGADVFGRHVDRRHLTDNPVSRYIGHHSVWFWPVVALAGVIVALLALRWLIAVLTPPPRAGDITIPTDRTVGRTALDSNALTDAVTDEIDSYRGVDTSHAKVYGGPADPQLAITVSTASDADIAEIRRRIEDGALAHTRQALDRPDLPITLDITLGNRQLSRVR